MFITRHAVETFAKNQVSHDVVVQPRRPLRHVQWLGPILVLLIATVCLTRGLRDDITEGLDIPDQERLGRPQGLVCECVLNHPPMGSVDSSVDLGMNAVLAHGSFDNRIPLRLLEVPFVIRVDLFYGTKSVERQSVRANTNDGA